MILNGLDSTIHEFGITNTELVTRWIPLLVTEDCRLLFPTEAALITHAGKWNKFAITLLPDMVKAQLLRAIELSGGTRYELARESAGIIIRDWLTRTEATLVARQRANFRIKSISIAIGALVVAYLIYLLMGLKSHPA
jgi:hypothetical protein